MHFLFLLLTFLAFFPRPAAAEPAESPVVVELFTSQSCASCPPADRLLENFSRKPGVIALACHVTYWDHLGWKDTLSRDFCTSRQAAYSQARGDLKVYTPQMIVNGGEAFIGSQRGEALDQIAQAQGVLKSIGMQIKDYSRLRATLPDLPGPGPYTLWLFGVKRGLSQDIKRGENSGKTVRYVNTALSLNMTDAWDGSAKAIDISLPAAKGIDQFVLIAQEGEHGPVKAAGQLALP